MSIIAVKDNDFRPDGNVAEGEGRGRGAGGLLQGQFPGGAAIPLAGDTDNPLHHYHVTVLDSPEALQRLVDSEGIQRFVERLFPKIAHSTQYLTQMQGMSSGRYGRETHTLH
jgi:hypothetical protein